VWGPAREQVQQEPVRRARGQRVRVRVQRVRVQRVRVQRVRVQRVRAQQVPAQQVPAQAQWVREQAQAQRVPAFAQEQRAQALAQVQLAPALQAWGLPVWEPSAVPERAPARRGPDWVAPGQVREPEPRPGCAAVHKPPERARHCAARRNANAYEPSFMKPNARASSGRGMEGPCSRCENLRGGREGG